MDTIAEIRRRHLVSGETISAIARSLKLSRPTVRKHLRTTAEPLYSRQQQPSLATGLSVKAIAYEVGYENVSFFVRLFRTHVGQTPAQWRKCEVVVTL